MSKFQNPSIKKIELTKKNFVIKIKAIGLTTCDNLVSNIKKTEDFNLTDSKGTILHHIVEHIKSTKLDKMQLDSIIDLVRNITELMSDHALNSVNEEGYTAVNLASNCDYNKISWAVSGMDMPQYVVDDYLDKSSTSKAIDIFHRNSASPQSYDSCLGGTNDMLGELLDES
jgi:S-adenosylmethionine synthetase